MKLVNKKLLTIHACLKNTLDKIKKVQAFFFLFHHTQVTIGESFTMINCHLYKIFIPGFIPFLNDGSMTIEKKDKHSFFLFQTGA